MLPTFTLKNERFSRLMFGGKLSPETLRLCEDAGIMTVILPDTPENRTRMSEYRRMGGKMNWISLAGEDSDSACDASAVCLDAEVTDRLYLSGEYDALRSFIRGARKTGFPAGIGTYMPEVIQWADDNGLDADFYLCGIFNLTQSGTFDELDVHNMFRTVRQTPKPVICFHLLAGGRRCVRDEHIRQAFQEAYKNMKITDAAVVGLGENAAGEITENIGYAAAAMERLKYLPYQGERDGSGKRTLYVPGSVPDYWKPALERTVEKYKQHQAGKKNISALALIADMHWEHNCGNAVPLINALKARTDLRRVIFAGDIIQGQPSLADASRAVDDWVRHMNGLGEDGWYAVRGNHDNNACWMAFTEADVWTDREYYDHVLRHAANDDPDGTGKLYGYADDPEARIRYVFLDTGSAGSTPPDPGTINTVSYEEQLCWLRDKAAELDCTWGIVVVQHIGFQEYDVQDDAVYAPEEQRWFSSLDGIGGDPVFDGQGHYKGPWMTCTGHKQAGICSGHIRALVPVLDAVAADPNGPEVIAVLTGHTHWDTSMKTAGGYFVIATTCDAGATSSTEYDVLCPCRIPGTDSEQLMDIVQIDRDDRKVYLTRLGSGYDREFGWDGKR